jgi:hypothetical protein
LIPCPLITKRSQRIPRTSRAHREFPGIPCSLEGAPVVVKICAGQRELNTERSNTDAWRNSFQKVNPGDRLLVA